MMTKRGRTRMLNGHEFSYLDSGEGPAVLFIHGLAGSHRNWARLVDRLNHDHRVLVPDLFGHGVSAKPMGDYSPGAHAATLRDLLDLLGIDRVTLVGHSFGGGIAMQFCYLFPERVDRLVLVASGGLGRDVSPLLRSATLPGAGWVLPLIARTISSAAATSGVKKSASYSQIAPFIFVSRGDSMTGRCSHRRTTDHGGSRRM